MLSIRQIGEDELGTLVEVSEQARPGEDTGGVAGFVDWRRQADEMVWLLAERDGEVAGAAYALTGWHTPRHRGIGNVLVAPARRGRGTGDALREWVERWAAGRGVTELEGPVAEDDAGSLAWAAARGYTEVGRNSRMVLDLTAITAPVPSLPDGVELVTWAERPELARGLWEVAREAVLDIPGEEDSDIGSLDEWLDRDMRGGGDRPEAVFIALEDGEVLGYAKLAFSEETTERAFHDLTGVRRAHRGRGIAAALKAAQIAWAKEAGYRTLQTANEVRNAPIRHLNAKHGYVLEPGNVIVRRGLVST